MARRPARGGRPGARRPGRAESGAESPTGVRIVAGTWRGRRLRTPPGLLLRPMREQVRGALFNILGPETVEGARVLDLFSGSGSLGIEALSRGALRAAFVEREPACLEVLRQNLAAVGAGSRATVVPHDLSRGVAALAAHGPFELVLMHPPFEVLRAAPGPGEADVAELLRELAASRELLVAGGTIAFETPRERWAEPDALSALGLLVELRREYGTTALFVTRQVHAPPGVAP